MVSLYRRESASPLHLRDRNCTYTPVKLSKTIVGQSLPSLISRSFRENGSHRRVVVQRRFAVTQERAQPGIVFQEIFDRFPKTRVRLHFLLSHFSFHPLPHLFHDLLAVSLVIFQALLRPHPFGRFLVLINLPYPIQHIAAFIRIKRSDLPKLPPRMRQADRLYSF